jgi:DNA-binding transcriptional regulator YdaS (Cro superfamily)
MNSVIARAIAKCGSQVALAQAIGVHPSFISQWLIGSRPVPAGRCRAIELATGGVITAAELRPDIFGDSSPNPSSGEAAA